MGYCLVTGFSDGMYIMVHGRRSLYPNQLFRTDKERNKTLL
jgi:hypothetical protein